MSQAGLIDIELAMPNIATSFTTDSGMAIPIGNNLEILGGYGLDSTGAGNVVTVKLSATLADGQLLRGTAGDPEAATLVAGTNVTITNTAGSITINSSGGGGSGDVVGPAGATDNAICKYDTATGKLIQDSSVLIDDTDNVTGIVDLTAGSLTLTTDLAVTHGGTGLSSTTAYAVLCGGTTGTAALQSIAALGAAGTVLTSNGAAALPTFQASGGGDLDSLTDVVITSEELGQDLVFDGTNWVNRNYADLFVFREDFMIGAPDRGIWKGDSTSGGSRNMGNSIASHLGIVELGTGSTNNAKTVIRSYQEARDCFLTGEGEITFRSITKLDTLSDAANEYEVFVGFPDVGIFSTTPGEAIFFEYIRTNSVYWRGTCRSSGSQTQTSGTDVAVSTNWEELKFVINAAGTSVEFFVDGVSIGAVAADIPSSPEGGIGFWLEKTVGTTTRLFHIDYCEVIEKFTSSRW